MVRMFPSLSLVLLLAACSMKEVPAPQRSGETAAMEAVSGFSRPAKADDEIRAHHLNIGAGMCVIVECPGDVDAAPLIVDCGSTGATDDDMNEDDVVEYISALLGAHGQAPIVTASHGDEDHYSYLPVLFEQKHPTSIWIGGQRDDYGENMAIWFSDQESASVEVHEEFPVGFSSNGQAVDGLACGTAQTFIMTVNIQREKNTNSLVLAIKHGDFGMIFSGDAEGTTEASAIENFPSNIAETIVLTGSHHGAATHGSNSDQWATAIKADAVIFSAGNKFKHPRCPAVDAYHGSLAAANPHPVRCGLSNTAPYQERETDQAEYVTEVNGAIVVTGRADGTYSIHCSRTEGCGLPGQISQLPAY